MTKYNVHKYSHLAKRNKKSCKKVWWIQKYVASLRCQTKIKIPMKRKVIKVSKIRAIQIAMNHNCVSREIAEKYSDSELREVLKHLKLKSDF